MLMKHLQQIDKDHARAARNLALGTLVLSALALPAQALGPIEALSTTGSGDRIFAHSMDIASDGRAFIAAEVQAVSGRTIVVRRSDDGGETWADWSVIGFPGLHYRNPSIHIAEGAVDRVFLAYEIGNAITNPTEGSVVVKYHDLDAPMASWTTHTILSTQPYPPTRPVVTSEAHSRSDYGVFVAFALDVKFMNQVAVARSLDQGTTWEEYYNTDRGAFFSGTLDVAVGPGDFLQVTLLDGLTTPKVSTLRSANRAASSSDWVSTGTLSNSQVRGRNPSIVSRPGTNEVFAAYTDFDEGTMRIHKSSDAGASWTSLLEAPEITLRDGDFAVGPLGYRLGGYDDPDAAVIGEPVGIDPLGPWTLRPTGPGFTSGHTYPARIDWDASHGGQWAILAHRETGTGEQLLFWSEWFSESSSVPDGAQAPRLRLWPNPATEFARIGLSGASPAPTDYRIYDVLGRIVARGDGAAYGLDNTLTWNLRDPLGHRVPSGSYFLEVRSGAASLGQGRVVVR